MIVAIHQPNYVPWLGYFRKLVTCDTFVFYDNVQMPMGKSYVSRTQVKLASGPSWLTVPTTKSSVPILIKDVKIVSGPWARKHLATLRSAYGGSQWLDEVVALLGTCFTKSHQLVADLNIEIISAIAQLLVPGKIKFVRASAMRHGATSAESILPILSELGATVYLTGSGAGSMRHLDVAQLQSSGIQTRFVSSTFPEYPQKHGSFASGLSIIDTLLNCGPEKVNAILQDARAI